MEEVLITLFDVNLNGEVSNQTVVSLRVKEGIPQYACKEGKVVILQGLDWLKAKEAYKTYREISG